MTDILFAVQGALVSLVAGSAEMQALIGDPPRLFDHVPPGADFPYVTFGSLSVEPYDDKNDTGFQQLVGFDIWSRYRGGKEMKDIAQALYDTLHRAAPVLGSGVLVLCEFHSAEMGPLNDGLTYHATLRFIVITQSA